MSKVYLGDSVYVEEEYGSLTLTTENGGDPSNTIFLDSQVFDALLRYAELNGFTVKRSH